MKNLIRILLTFSGLLFTGFCFLKAGTGLISVDRAVSLTEVEAAVPARITQQRLQTTPIQKMRPGMRVLGRNPDRLDTQTVIEPDPVSWRLVSVRMEQQPGQFVLGQLLRPTSWIRHNNALPGAVIQLEIPEMHVAGDAEVLSIADCPPIRRGPGSVVTGTFQHVSDEVISVFVEGEAEPIGATSQHPFWSRDRNAFVPAGELRIGEELKTALGTSTRVTSIEIRAGPETVYGLEVAGEHVYQITQAGLLVHNASGKSGSISLTIKEPSILTQKGLSDTERTLLQKHFRIKSNAIQRAAKRGELKWSPGTSDVRISELQAAHRARVAERFERIFGQKLNMDTLNADHPMDLILGGVADQRLRMLNESINKSFGASFLQAGRKAKLQPGQPIQEIIIQSR